MSQPTSRRVPCQFCGTPVDPGRNRRRITCPDPMCQRWKLRMKNDRYYQRLRGLTFKGNRICDTCQDPIPDERRTDTRFCGPKCHHRAAHVRRTYGISQTDIRTMHQEQTHKCLACHEPLDITFSKQHAEKPRYAIDHCAETGVVRGLIHPNCNTALGLMYEDPLRIRKLADYASHAQMLKLRSVA